jgi:hypothetical protein
MLPLKEFIEKANIADAMGPIFDPTLWRAGHEKLELIINIAKALQTLQAKIDLETINLFKGETNAHR